MDIEIDSKKQFIELSAESHEEKSTADVEFQLDNQIDNEPIDTPEAPLTLSEPLSMPAALCDDLLLEEINSIPDKMGFKIGDVADLLGIKQYVLRYWESEFDVLKPKKAHNNQRLYTKKDVENAFLIRKLLHRDRFSIEGARSALKGLKAYVKKENQKEKELKQAFNKIESYQERLENVAFDVRRIRQLFK
ncbi:MAG: MerR family transcriptional regulator [Bdellovibrionales bacterium]|nr:MerR family transcriptional regulator [Bdellovibrionales bacterium]